MKKLKHTNILILFVITLFLNTGCSKKQIINSANQITSQIEGQQKTNSYNSYGGISQQDYNYMQNLVFQNGDTGIVEINKNNSTLNVDSWKYNHVIYQNLDRLNRTSKANIAFLEKRNLANDSLRVRQTVNPTGWHYNARNGVQLYNRGHLIAYSLSAGIDQNGNYNPNNVSGDQNNPKNLFTQSAYANQKLQTIYESKVREALKENKKVIFEATPIFKDNNLMANGINLQALSTDKTLNFNVFIFNVQPDYKYDYTTGRAIKDSSVNVKNIDETNFNYGKNAVWKSHLSRYIKKGKSTHDVIRKSFQDIK